MIIIGSDHEIKEIGTSDLNEYLNFNYPNISINSTQILSAIAKIIGNYKFLQNEYYLRKQNYYDNGVHQSNNIDFPSLLISHFFTNIMTEQERIDSNHLIF